MLKKIKEKSTMCLTTNGTKTLLKGVENKICGWVFFFLTLQRYGIYYI